MTFSVNEVAALDYAVLTVSMDNYDAIAGLQFDVVSDNGFTLDGDFVKVSSRATGLEITAGQIDKKTLRVVGIMKGGTIPKGDGGLMTIGLIPVQSLTPGNSHLKVSNVKLSSSTMVNRYAGPAEQNVPFKVINSDASSLGDINNDGVVDNLDLTLVADYIMGRLGKDIDLEKADANGDGVINAADLVVIANYIKGSRISP